MSNILHLPRAAAPPTAAEVRDALSPWVDAAPSRVPADIWEVKRLPAFGQQRQPRAVAADEPEPRRAALPLAA